MEMHKYTVAAMSRLAIARATAACFFVLATGHSFLAQASLGAGSASVEADRLRMKAAEPARLLPSPGSYTVNETTLPSGTKVRQYVSSAGVVFAVSWSGPFPPDLRQLLGPHFAAMVSEQARQAGPGHRAFALHQPDLVIEAGGHQRSFAGRAYLPLALPTDANVQDIR